MMASSMMASSSRPGDKGQAMVKPKSHAQTESFVDVTKVFDVAEYNIPEICMFPVELKHVRCSYEHDLLMRNSLEIGDKVPFTVEILKSCTIPADGLLFDVSKFRIPKSGLITVIWKWNYLIGSDGSDNSSSDNSSSEHSSSVEENDINDDSEPEENRCMDRPHKLTFKCIGSRKESSYQHVLRVTRDKLSSGSSVPVRLVKEPLNPYDSRAIAFKCELDSKWCTIGYVVRELTEEVRDAMDRSRIVSVKFAWVNYVVHWRSGPGFFAGITIEKLGQWSVLARRKASTR